MTARAALLLVLLVIVVIGAGCDCGSAMWKRATSSGKNAGGGGGVRKVRDASESWQESCWDYPRPPRLESCHGVRIQIWACDDNGEQQLIADSTNAHRVLETFHPPTYYIPRHDFAFHHDADPRDGGRGGEVSVRRAGSGTTWCEFKGVASYWTLVVGAREYEQFAWSYENAGSEYERIRGALAVYAGRVARCQVDGMDVTPQAGPFYGGWITPNITGPFKGPPGTEWW